MTHYAGFAVNRECRTPHNGSGFLCDDRVTCLPPSALCDGSLLWKDLTLITYRQTPGITKFTCVSGDLPNNLPSNLVFWCGNSRFWIFVDKKCNKINDCGDCSDEIGIYFLCISINTSNGFSSEWKTSIIILLCFLCHVIYIPICACFLDADCPPCGSQWWTCTPVEFQYCLCIPRSLCKDGRQHCYDWSDEYVCSGG
ncbi:low-density lipoprotein receptor class A domain-containing protein 1 [Clupea harengus]|uniref:Low-density lipoprotein receptor class A domain-containing protein 1 n=1 Tax=Clupea harengus TaxID=7950 RepID=A0A8M1K5N8_CLUHA|nr:low-density lipoprotein receptor class A domain-containing protein 1 [Clupea harengus]